MEFKIEIKVIKQPDVLEQSIQTFLRLYNDDHSSAIFETDLEEDMCFSSLFQWPYLT